MRAARPWVYPPAGVGNSKMAALQPTYPVAFPANQAEQAPADLAAAAYSTFRAPAIAADAVQNATHLVDAAR